MADIIEFGKRAGGFKAERETSLRQRKIDALKKIFQCTRCLLKCAKCGAQVEEKSEESTRFATPLPMCKSCYEEYGEYRERAAGGKGDSASYWYNASWMKVWESWLDHQKALDEYRQSREFLQLLEEVENLLRK